MPVIGRKRVDKAIQAKVSGMNQLVKAIYFKGLGNIISITPVHFKDGGRLKNNWFLSVGSPEFGSSLIADKNGTASEARLQGIPKKVLGKKVYFTNNLPYANKVEYGGYPKEREEDGGTHIGGGKRQYLSKDGFSEQAPNGMVRVNLKKMQKWVRDGNASN